MAQKKMLAVGGRGGGGHDVNTATERLIVKHGVSGSVVKQECVRESGTRGTWSS